MDIINGLHQFFLKIESLSIRLPGTLSGLKTSENLRN
jgi:hypothetical protein